MFTCQACLSNISTDIDIAKLQRQALRLTTGVQIKRLDDESLRLRVCKATMTHLKVLVSNDDGIAAPGIVALVRALGSIDLCDVYVSAPAQERSASSHAITLGQHITATHVPMQGTMGPIQL